MTDEIIIAGFGGQGVLSMGKILAYAGLMEGKEVTWMPAYGPEQRGGSANCSVILSRNLIGSPVIDDNCNLLIAMTQVALDKFLHELKPNGVLIYDSSTMKVPDHIAESHPVFGIKALDIALELGSLKCANSVILGALSAILVDRYLEGADKLDFDRAFEEAIIDCFNNKPEVIKLNLCAFYEGKKAVKFN